MVERLAIAGAAAFLGWMVWRALRARALRRAASLSLGLEGYRPGRAAIVLFSTPDCAPCETIQRPALAQVGARFNGSLHLLEVDAVARPDLADAWGVLGVPTTFVIDRTGRARRVNHGPVPAGTLMAQLEEIGVSAAD